MRGQTSRIFDDVRDALTSVKHQMPREFPPSSAFGTFSPRKKPRGEKGSRWKRVPSATRSIKQVGPAAGSPPR